MDASYLDLLEQPANRVSFSIRLEGRNRCAVFFKACPGMKTVPLFSEQEGNEHLGLLDVGLIGGAEETDVLRFLRLGGRHQEDGCCQS